MLEATTSFEQFCGEVQPRLRHAFAARYGHTDSADATAEALAYAWEHWEQICLMENAAGYLYRVGLSKTRRIRRSTPLLAVVPPEGIPDVEPGLPTALASLTQNQRVAVTLVVGFGWKLHEVAKLLDVSIPTVQSHVGRGMKKLRAKLGEAS